MDWQEDFGKRLAQLRAKKGVSARDMSLSIGQGASYINGIENGHNLPSMTVFFYICEYLGVTPEQFFADETSDPAALSPIIEDMKKLKPEQIKVFAAMLEQMKK